ncbi:dynamin family protein [Microbacterium sp. BWT-B31]|uniref:dynamin family protein n=1 Tax=Microbacterium sp. BWT-B31 TaxID=3232072 RepID=UPI0035298BF4
MTAGVLEDAGELVRLAQRTYADDDDAMSILADLDRRIHEPLRLALAGMVKAGKSTLLNAILGEQIAPTDAGECTRVVTWYRYAATPSITLHPHEGAPHRLPVRRDDGHLVLDLAGFAPEEIDWIDVGWPSGALTSMILIDTPGIASLSQDVSARSTMFLLPERSPSSADAIVYLLRHLHASDVRFLESFRDTAAGASETVNAVAVLSRADEIGSGRIDSLLSAGNVARRYESDGELASLALAVLPVAGLLAEGGRTLREGEFAALRELAALDRRDRERLLVSADRFARPTDTTTQSEQTRRELLGRFGIFGVRLATALIRGGVRDSTELAERLVQQSGLTDLTGFVRLHFRSRAVALKVRGVIHALEELVADRPHDGAREILAGIERLQSSSHPLRELALLSQIRTSRHPLPPADADDVARRIGGDGVSARSRLGLAESTSREEVRALVESELGRWRARGQSPLTDRATADICRVVIRSLEAIASEVAGDDRPTPHVVLAGGPGQGRGEGAHQQGEHGEHPLHGEGLPQEHSVLSARGEL